MKSAYCHTLCWQAVGNYEQKGYLVSTAFKMSFIHPIKFFSCHFENHSAHHHVFGQECGREFYDLTEKMHSDETTATSVKLDDKLDLMFICHSYDILLHCLFRVQLILWCSDNIKSNLSRGDFQTVNMILSCIKCLLIFVFSSFLCP